LGVILRVFEVENVVFEVFWVENGVFEVILGIFGRFCGEKWCF
jgi:hypothetical protein